MTDLIGSPAPIGGAPEPDATELPRLMRVRQPLPDTPTGVAGLPNPEADVSKFLSGREYLHPEQPTSKPGPESVLDSLFVDRSVKADAWDAYHTAETPEDFKKQFDALALPKPAKATLFDLKFSGLPLSSAAPIKHPAVPMPNLGPQSLVPPIQHPLEGALGTELIWDNVSKTWHPPAKPLSVAPSAPPTPAAEPNHFGVIPPNAKTGMLGGPSAPVNLGFKNIAPPLQDMMQGPGYVPPTPDPTQPRIISPDDLKPPPIFTSVSRRIPGTTAYRGQDGSIVSIPGSKPQGEQMKGTGDTTRDWQPSPEDMSLGQLTKLVASTPIVSHEDIENAFPFLVGPFAIERGVLNAASDMTPPLNVAITAATLGAGALPGAAGRILSTGMSALFATQAGKALMAKYEPIKKAVVAGDWDKVGELGGEGLVDAAMLAGAGYHAATGALNLPSDVRGVAREFNDRFGKPKSVSGEVLPPIDPFQGQRQVGGQEAPQPPPPTFDAQAETPGEQPEEHFQAEPGDHGPQAKPTSTVNVAAFERAHSIWHKYTTEAADKFMQENPGATWDDALSAVTGTVGREPEIGDYKAMPEPLPPAPLPEPVEPPESVKPDKVAKVGPGTQNPPTAATQTEPESPATIAIQMQDLAIGKRKVVMFPGGIGMPALGTYPAGDIRQTSDKFGNTYLYRGDMTHEGEIKRAAADNTLPELLGHSVLNTGTVDKSEIQGEPIAVSAHAQDGTEAHTAVAGEAQLPTAIAAAHALTPPGGSVHVGTPEQALEGRTPGLAKQVAGIQPGVYTFNTGDKLGEYKFDGTSWYGRPLDSTREWSKSSTPGIYEDAARAGRMSLKGGDLPQSEAQGTIGSPTPIGGSPAVAALTPNAEGETGEDSHDDTNAAYHPTLADLIKPLDEPAPPAETSQIGTPAPVGEPAAAPQRKITSYEEELEKRYLDAYKSTPIPPGMWDRVYNYVTGPGKHGTITNDLVIGSVAGTEWNQVALGNAVYGKLIADGLIGPDPNRTTGYIITAKPSPEQQEGYDAARREELPAEIQRNRDSLANTQKRLDKELSRPEEKRQSKASQARVEKWTNRIKAYKRRIGRLNTELRKLNPVAPEVQPVQAPPEQAPAPAATGMGAAADKQVRDLPVRATVKDGKISVVIRYQRKPAVSFSFPLAEWTATEAHYNPNYPQRQLAESKLLATDIEKFVDQEAERNERMNSGVVNRLVDSVASAVREAVKKSQAPPTAPSPLAGRGAVLPIVQQTPNAPEKFAAATSSGERTPSPVLQHPFTYFSGKDSEQLRSEAQKRGDVGLMVTPMKPEYLARAEFYPAIAIDNGVFSKATQFDADDFIELIEKAANDPAIKAKVQFVVAPDAVGDAVKTLELYKQWEPGISALGLPVAFVAQNGLEDHLDEIPWDKIDTLFVGGTTEWKEGDVGQGDDKSKTPAEQDKDPRYQRYLSIFEEAKRRGIPTHVGRVNTFRRMDGVHKWGWDASTADGTMLAYGEDKNWPQLASWLDYFNHGTGPKVQLHDEPEAEVGPAAAEESVAPVVHQSWKPEFQVAGEGDKWHGNNTAFPTEAEAEQAGRAKFNSWFGATAFRTVESDQEPNFNYVDGQLVKIEPKPVTKTGVVSNGEPQAPQQAESSPEASTGTGRGGAGRGGRALREPDNRTLENELPEAGEGTGEPAVTFTGSTEGSGQDSAGDGTVLTPGLAPGVRTGDAGVGHPAEPLTEEDVTESNDKGQTVVEREHPPKDPAVVGTTHARDYRIPDGRIIKGTPEQRAAINIKVLKLLDTLALEDRVASVDEQEILAGYVGWGGAKQLFTEKPEWAEMQAEVRSLMTPEEYEAARTSTMNAHYTGDQVADSIWHALRHFGAKPGMSFLETSIGAGVLFGRQPEDLLEGSRRIGIEKDATTARIAKYLYPDSGIEHSAYEKADLPTDYFDFAASNVPFGQYGVFDPKFRKQPYLTASIHNYFFAKALDHVRPGGIIAFITSRYTMDSYDTPALQFRKYVAGKADFLGAVRLPAGAFKQASNTDVITDMVFMRRRVDDAVPGDENEPWQESLQKTFSQPDRTRYSHAVNEYYHTHPEMIIGEEGLQRGQFSDHDYDVKGNVTPELLNAAIERIPSDQFRDWSGRGRIRPGVRLRDVKTDTNVAGSKVGGFFFDKDGNLFRKTSQGEAVPEPATELTKSRIRGQLHLRDITTALNTAERRDAPVETLDEMRKLLNDAYDAFVKRHGFLSSRQNRKAMLGDPDAPLLPSLERKYDAGDKKEGRAASAKKGPIFTERLFKKPEPVDPKDAKEALSVTLNARGFLDWDHLKSLTNMTDSGLMGELAGLVYVDPDTLQHELAEDYLSGSVRTKLRAAQAMAKMDPAFAANVTALKVAQPEDVPPSRIRAMLGVTWVPLEVYAQFIKETLNLRYTPNVAHFGNEWSIGVDEHPTSRWDTRRVPAGRLIDAAFNLRRVKVYDPVAGGKAEINRDETLAASQRQKEINDHFEKWLFADPVRGDALVRVYNDLQNDLRLRTFNGSHLSLPGMSRIGLRGGNLDPHQLAAVWRQIVQRNVLLNHAPGAGKTFEMIAAGMELKRLGLIQRPMYVVPNSTLGGWQDMFASLYPEARVLVFSETDLAKDKRRAAVARMATGNWDAVVVPHSSFQFIPVGDDVFNEHYRQLEEELSASIRDAEDAGLDTRLVTRLERARENLLTGLQRKRDAQRQDNVVSWEQLGIDQLFVDESHEFKKLGFATKQSGIAGIDQAGNQKTFDLRMKVNYTQNHGRGVVFASGTPVTNTMGEIHSIMRYLIAPELKARGIEKFDDWAAEFGRIVDTFEAKPEGGGYHMKARFARFVNLPRLATLLRTFSDVMTSDMLDIPRPNLAGGERRVVLTHMSPDQIHFQEHLQARAAGIRSNPRGAFPDNMLVVFGDGGKMAMDIRLVDPRGKDDPDSRLSKVAENVYHLWKQSADVKGTQLVFSDVGVPADSRGSRRNAGAGPGAYTGFSVYDEIIRKLVELGIPRNEIAQIGVAKNKDQRKRLFQLVDEGTIRVLIGSSQKMGIGVNVQTHGYGLHHVDLPPRPDILDQREARFIRQGNINPEVHILYYTTKGSLDENKFGNVVRKGKFINNLWKGDFTQEEAEDLSDGVPSWEMFQALTSGDPRILRKLEVDNEVGRLSSLHWAFQDQMYRFRFKLQQAKDEIERLNGRLGYLTEAKEAVEKTGRVWTINGQTFSGEGVAADAGKALVDAAQKRTGTLGTAHGLSLIAMRNENGLFVGIWQGPVEIAREDLSRWILTPKELADNIAINKTHFDVDPAKWRQARLEPDKPGTLITRLETDIRNIGPSIGAAHNTLMKNEDEVTMISKDVNQTWPYQEDYDKLVAEQQQLLRDLGLLRDDASIAGMEDGEEIQDDSVAAAEPEPSMNDDEDEESGDEEDDNGALLSRVSSGSTGRNYGKNAGPMSEYKPGSEEIPPPSNGWYEQEIDGSHFYSDGSIAIKGATPEAEAPARKVDFAPAMKSDNSVPAAPLAFANTVPVKNMPSRRLVIFSRTNAFDAVYYDYVIARYPDAITLLDAKKNMVTFQVNGTTVAVMMGLHDKVIPANIKPLLPVNPSEEATPVIGSPGGM